MAQRKRRKMKGGGNRLARVASLPSAISNHPQWYEHYPLEHLMGINFGMREKMGRTIPTPVATSNPNIESAPDSVITLELSVPTGTTAFRESMQILMNKLRAASGSNITYSVNDLAAYVLNARELYAYYSIARKIILETRITDIYDQDAHVKYAVMAVGRAATTLNDITVNLASDTTRLNRIAGVISAMIPIKMSLMERTAWLFSNVFADATTAKFSTKQFGIAHTKQWEVDEPNDKVKAIDFQAFPITLTALIDRIESLLGIFTSNTQNSRIAGDLLKAFGAFFTALSPVDEGTRIVPIYDEAALTQIQNLTMLPGIDDTNIVSDPPQFEVSAGAAVVKYRTTTAPAVANYFNSVSGHNKILNSYKDSLSPGEIVSLTRLASVCSVADENSKHFATVLTCGTEIAVMYRYGLSINAAGQVTNIDYSMTAANPIAVNTTHVSVFALAHGFTLMDYWSRDDWAPMFILFTAGTTAAPTDAFTLFDLSNWASIDQNNLAVFHQAAALSLTATPQSIVEQSSFRFLS